MEKRKDLFTLKVDSIAKFFLDSALVFASAGNWAWKGQRNNGYKKLNLWKWLHLEKKIRLMAAVVGLWMSLKHFINHSCTHTKLTEMVCVGGPSSASLLKVPVLSPRLIPPGRWPRPRSSVKSSACLVQPAPNVCVSTDWGKYWCKKDVFRVDPYWNNNSVNPNHFSGLNRWKTCV